MERLVEAVQRHATERAQRFVGRRMEVLVETPDGALLVAEKIITIRSTAFNRIALGITLGAFGFLVVFYLLRVFRRRGEETD